jgi:hypothetical protein
MARNLTIICSSRMAYFRGSFRPILTSRLPLFKAAVEYQQRAAKQTMEEVGGRAAISHPNEQAGRSPLPTRQRSDYVC